MASHSTDRPVTVVNIISTGLSGSTWVNLLLGSHPEAFSIGEMRDVRKHGKAVCVLHDESCPVWSRFDAQSDENWFHQISRITGRRVLILNNGRKFLDMQREPGISAKFVHLVRDGRAVVASMIRKYPDRSTWRATRMWRHDLRRNERLIRRQPRPDTCEVIYERIKGDTANELMRVCAFLDLEFSPRMLDFWEVDHHYLGGNKGTLFGMTQKGNKQPPIDVRQRYEGDSAPKWDLDHYKTTDPAQFVDERWRQELSAKQVRLFGVLAGRLNRKYGYR